jgi:hypothetical protein
MKIVGETSSGFVLHAKEFLVAAELVLNRQGASLPVYFLFGRSIELSLKAFLLQQGMGARDLKSKKFGHDLAALFAAAKERELEKWVSFDEREVGVLQLLNYDYLEKRFEYRVTGGTYHLPLIDVTEQVARKLVHGIQKYCSQT